MSRKEKENAPGAKDDDGANVHSDGDDDGANVDQGDEADDDKIFDVKGATVTECKMPLK